MLKVICLSEFFGSTTVTPEVHIFVGRYQTQGKKKGFLKGSPKVL